LENHCLLDAFASKLSDECIWICQHAFDDIAIHLPVSPHEVLLVLLDFLFGEGVGFF
jgi:hypothetical protein